MKSRGARVLFVVLAVAAIAAAGAAVWQIEQRVAAGRSAADTFERDARQAVVALANLRSAQQAYVAEGQPAEAWMTKAAEIAGPIGPKLSAMRVASGSVEAQASMESAIESFTAYLQSDARARDYVKSGQRLSASDVIFTEAWPVMDRAVAGIDTARGQESVAHAVAIEGLRVWEIVALAAAAVVALLVMLILVPVPRGVEAEAGSDDVVLPKRDVGLHLSRDLEDGVVRRAQPIPEGAGAGARAADASKGDSLGPIDFGLGARGSGQAPDLEAVADLCAALARVQDTRELQGLLERTAKALEATGVIVWMPDGPQGALRPVLAHGYAPLALSRMGIIHPAADNATATAYRTRSAVLVPAEVLASGAVVAPLVTAEGCSGALAVELREGVDATPQISAIATIVAAQLATLFTPAGGAAVSGAEAASALSTGATSPAGRDTAAGTR